MRGLRGGMPPTRMATMVGRSVFGGGPRMQEDNWQINSPSVMGEKPVVKSSLLSAILAGAQRPTETPFEDPQRLAGDDSLGPPSISSKKNISSANTPMSLGVREVENLSVGLLEIPSNDHISKSSRENSGIFSVGHERKFNPRKSFLKGITLPVKKNLGKNFGVLSPGLGNSKQIADMVDEQFSAKAVEVLKTMAPESDEFKSAVRKFYRCNIDKDKDEGDTPYDSQMSLRTRPKESRATMLWKRANSILKQKKANVAPEERWTIGGGGPNQNSVDNPTNSNSSKNSRPPKSQGQASPWAGEDAKSVPIKGKGFGRIPNMVIQEEHSMSDPDEGMH
jgi:hypothetical protein